MGSVCFVYDRDSFVRSRKRICLRTGYCRVHLFRPSPARVISRNGPGTNLNEVYCCNHSLHSLVSRGVETGGTILCLCGAAILNGRTDRSVTTHRHVMVNCARCSFIFPFDIGPRSDWRETSSLGRNCVWLRPNHCRSFGRANSVLHYRRSLVGAGSMDLSHDLHRGRGIRCEAGDGRRVRIGRETYCGVSEPRPCQTLEETSNNRDNRRLDADRPERKRREGWVKLTGSSYC